MNLSTICHEVKRVVKSEFNYRFFREFRYNRVVRRHLRQYYTADASRAHNTRKMVVSMFDGRRKHGGLGDRLRGIVCIYAYCKEHGLDFRIRFVSPFRLEEFLEPGRYDWRVGDDELSYHPADACAVYMDTGRGKISARELQFQRRITDRFLSRPYRQIHVYSNLCFEEERFSELYHELFRPAAWLQRLVDGYVAELGQGYISVSTRFLELLGDFNEHRDRPAEGLPAEEQEELIERCLRQIVRIREAHPDAPCILVTSDSARFLERAAQLDFVRVLPGKIGHMDVAGNDEREVHTKTFIDFLVLSHAAELYLLVEGPMYRSNFSLRASQLEGKPFHVVEG